MEWIIGIIGGLILGGLLVFIYYRIKLNNANVHVTDMLEKSRKEGETIKKEIILEGKDEAIQLRQKVEDDYKERTIELRTNEKEQKRREQNLDRKIELIDRRSESIQSREDKNKEKERTISLKENEIEKIRIEEQKKLERISGISRQQARKSLMDELYDKARTDAQVKVKEIKEDAILNANKEAKKVIIEAIQRSAADHTADTTVTSVSLPNDQMKGRVIGREGRNIRHFEAQTGIELIIDDTPEAVVLSGFDPVRREIARIALEKLIKDGRIHPARIEEMVKKAKEEVDESIKEAAEDALMEVKLPPLPKELMFNLGKLKYRTSYGQNVLKHSIEVAWLAGLMAAELNLDGNIAKRAGLLHDIGKAIDRNIEGTHALIGAELARKNKEKEVIINAIESHHEEVEMTSPISAIVQAADAISGARRGARGQTLENYIQRMEKLENISNGFKGVSKTYAIQAGREVRVIVEQSSVSDKSADLLAEDIAENIQKEMTYPGQIKVTVIREHRSVGYAK